MRNRTGKPNLVLASKSPRRTALLKMVGIDHVVMPARSEEPVLFSSDEIIDEARAREICCQLAESKAKEVASRFPGRIVCGADTIVVVEGRCFGKPEDESDAKRMLRMLSGKTHQVYTGLCLISNGHLLSDAVRTDVTFYPWSDEMETLVNTYADSGVPLDKAGAYGIQDFGALLVERIEGDYYNVVGFPLATFWRLLAAFEETL
ncbi:MAG TPA: septum formation protein Maf [Fastidiosipila sp.]|nr:septum formation protein Maf [Fastidiosipila sp.]